MSEQSPLHGWVGMSADVSTLLRELCVVAAFKSRLSRLGVSKVETPVGEIDISGAGGTVANLNRGIQDAIARLQELEAAPENAHMSAELQPIIDYLGSFQQEAATADATIKTNLVTHQAALAQSSPQIAKSPGWLLVGHVSKDKQSWLGDMVQNVPSTVSPTLTLNQTFNVTNTVYLRADEAAGHHYGGKVIGVVPANGQVQVISAPDYSAAIAGGWFLWVKVQPLPNAAPATGS